MRLHAQGCFPADAKDAIEIDVEDLAPFLVGGFDERCASGHAGIVDEHADGAERLFGGIETGLHRCGLRDVHFDRMRDAAGAANFCRDLLEFVQAACSQRDPGAGRRQHEGEVPAEPT